MARCYGWTDDYIEAMPYRVMVQYLKSIDALMSKEAMLMINATSYPHSTKQGRNDIWRNLKKPFSLIGDNRPRSAKEIAMNFARKLRGG